jgi:probable phosphoglycerate mutase
MPDLPAPDVVLVRHGETEWTVTRRHTGNTDIPLTDDGRRQAGQLGRRLAGERFARVLSSPLARAFETCRLALPDRAGRVEVEVRDELREWDYGAYEGRTSADIRDEAPGWLLWTDGVVGGETIGEVAARVDRVIADIRSGPGPVAVFAHGHLLRVFAARWLEQPATLGAHLTLGPGSLCRLGWEHGVPAVELWNDRSHMGA